MPTRSTRALTIHVKVSPAERAMLEAAAERRGRSVQALCRDWALARAASENARAEGGQR